MQYLQIGQVQEGRTERALHDGVPLETTSTE
jgi:hypothetical protein